MAGIALTDTGLSVSVGTGGRQKWNRTRFGLPKAHWLDAACVGHMTAITVLIDKPLLVTCRGQGGRQKVALNAFGYPIRHNSLKPIHGWRTGDIAKCDGKLWAVTPRVTGSFGISRIGEKPTSKSMAKLVRVHRMDSYKYA